MILDLEPDDELEDNPNQSDLVRHFFDFALLLFCGFIILRFYYFALLLFCTFIILLELILRLGVAVS
jgi:hypothetical protein